MASSRRWFAAFLLLGVPAVARADERPLRFSLAAQGLDRCGGAAVLSGAVEERLQRSVFTTKPPDVEIEVAADHGHARIVEKARTGEELGRREVPLPDDCPKAIETLAVVLAIMIGPPRTTTEPPPAEEKTPEPETPEKARAIAKSPPQRDLVRLSRPHEDAREREKPRWSAAPFAGVLGGSGILPGLAWGLEVGAVVHPPVRSLALVARGAYWPAQMTPTLPPADVDRISVEILGCYELVRVFALCGGIDGSRLAARSSDLTRPSESSLVAAVLGEARVRYRLHAGKNVFLEPYLAPQLAVLLRRDRFTYRDPAGQERILLLPAPAAFQTSLGVAVHFL